MIFFNLISIESIFSIIFLNNIKGNWIINKINSIKGNNINKTLELLDKSYCPYSKFRVASSVITKDNKFFPGVNIENVSYGLTMCAERRY